MSYDQCAVVRGRIQDRETKSVYMHIWAGLERDDSTGWVYSTTFSLAYLDMNA